jgi:hypothetical protein
MLVTPEATKSLKVQVATTLLQAGFTMAKISKMNNTAGRRWENYHGGFTFLLIKEIIWHDGSITPSKLRVRRWAESENPFTNSRQLNLNDYKVCLEAAGFITEVKGKDLFVLGKESIEENA